MTSLETPPPSAMPPPGNGNARLMRIVLPVVVLAAGLVAWDLVVRLNQLPPYVLPGPALVFKTLVADRSRRSRDRQSSTSVRTRSLIGVDRITP